MQIVTLRRVPLLSNLSDEQLQCITALGTEIKLDRDPYLLETNIPGVFAVGDVRHGSIKRVASGVGEGSICVQFVHQYLANVGS